MISFAVEYQPEYEYVVIVEYPLGINEDSSVSSVSDWEFRSTVSSQNATELLRTNLRNSVKSQFKSFASKKQGISQKPSTAKMASSLFKKMTTPSQVEVVPLVKESRAVSKQLSALAKSLAYTPTRSSVEAQLIEEVQAFFFIFDTNQDNLISRSEFNVL